MVRWQDFHYGLPRREFSVDRDTKISCKLWKMSVDLWTLSQEHASELLGMHKENKTIKERRLRHQRGTFWILSDCILYYTYFTKIYPIFIKEITTAPELNNVSVLVSAATCCSLNRPYFYELLRPCWMGALLHGSLGLECLCPSQSPVGMMTPL